MEQFILRESFSPKILKSIDKTDFSAYKTYRNKFFSPNCKRIVPLLQREMIEGQKFTSIMKLLDSASTERK